ncbi:MAG: LysR family transcriptional regulator [Thermoleophilaceae bacterium]|nr:LysR family transcriptional regulator [Thermoleophilaceae bacterium]
MLDVRRMRVLREVALRGSFSAAAEALSYTQSAVSQQIAALERECGAKLVQRGARGIRLTQAGEVLVRHADAVLAQLADAQAELDAIAGLRGGRLSLATFPSAGASLLPVAVSLFREAHPAVELTMIEAEPQDSLPLVKAAEIDLALVYEPNLAGEEAFAGLDRRQLLEDPLYAVLPAHHPLAARAKVRVADLASEPFVNPSPNHCGSFDLLLRAAQRAGFEPRIAFQTDDYVAIQGLVAAGVGVALIPALGLAPVRDDLVVRPLADMKLHRTICCCSLPSAERSPAAAAMLEMLTQAVGRFREDGLLAEAV